MWLGGGVTDRVVSGRNSWAMFSTSLISAQIEYKQMEPSDASEEPVL